MKFSKWENFLTVLIVTAILSAGTAFALKDKSYSFSAPAGISAESIKIPSEDGSGTAPLPQKLTNPPEIIKSIYVTGYSAGAKTYIKYLADFLKNTEINSVVVDIKGSDGYVTYNSSLEDVQKYHLTNYAIPNINAFVQFLHDQNIYVIGRIAVFEDPVYAKARPELAIYNKSKTTDLSQPVLWKDNNGLSWLDPASKDAWDYDVALAKDGLSHGFDEINFDYVRFPSDGKTGNMGFPVYDGKIAKPDVIKTFFHYLRTSLPDEKISADLFGLTTVNTDDMGIGQIIENAFENFDYVSLMVYPSHYANGFIGFSNPADHPYEVIKYSMDSALAKEKAVEKQRQDLSLKNSEPFGSPAYLSGSLIQNSLFVPLAKFRPWLQDFNMGAIYTPKMVKDEIKASQDALGGTYSGYMLWNPSNIYSGEAVLKAN